MDTPLTSTTSAGLFRLFTRVKPPSVGWNWNCCAFVPLHANCWITVPLAEAAPRASTHLPLPLFVTAYQAVGEIGPGSGLPPPVCPPSQSSPSIMNRFWSALANVEDNGVFVW